MVKDCEYFKVNNIKSVIHIPMFKLFPIHRNRSKYFDIFISQSQEFIIDFARGSAVSIDIIILL